MRESTARRLRRVALGTAAAATAAVGAVATQRAAARRLRGRPDQGREDDLARLPDEELRVTSGDGTRLHVRAIGPRGAPALVFLHGITLDMTTWHYQWRAFSDRFRCVLVDQRAHGRSSKPPTGDYSLQAMGRDIQAVLDQAVGDGPAVLVGHSMGGMAILSFARQVPDEFGKRVVGAVFVDTAASDLLREAFGGALHRVGWAIRRVGGRLTTRLDLADRLQRGVQTVGRDLSFLIAWATNFGPDAAPSHVEHVTRIASSAPVEVWVNALQDLLDMDLRHAIEHVRVPALVVVGDRDLVTPKASAQALRSTLPDARAFVIAGAGHVSMLEKHEVFNGLLGSYLDELMAGGPPGRSAEGDRHRRRRGADDPTRRAAG